ncbi:hypothetical protein GE09DRAFT_1143449 [Coniochaeta sp. 2T2.1]|nr:hypothetical protein GE09DRAFT_1143449 [Coniochaeta sp. 2T2.1]
MLFKVFAIASLLSLAQQAVAAPTDATNLADTTGRLTVVKRAGEDCSAFQFMSVGRLVAKNQAVMIMDLQYSYDTKFWADLPVLQDILSGETGTLDMSASGVERNRDFYIRVVNDMTGSWEGVHKDGRWTIFRVPVAGARNWQTTINTSGLDWQEHCTVNDELPPMH